MKTTPVITPRHEARILSQTCDEAARLFFDESFDDYASAVVTYREDGSALVQCATGRNSWDSLLNASSDVQLASRLAELDTRDGWRSQDMRPGLASVRPTARSSGRRRHAARCAFQTLTSSHEDDTPPNVPERSRRLPMVAGNSPRAAQPQQRCAVRVSILLPFRQ